MLYAMLADIIAAAVYLLLIRHMFMRAFIARAMPPRARGALCARLRLLRCCLRYHESSAAIRADGLRHCR